MSARCRSCGAAIIWARTESGRAMPVDAEPSEGGTVYLLADGADGVRAVIAGSRPEPLDHRLQERHTSHFATCPDHARWRKR